MAYLGQGYKEGDKIDVLFQLDENNFRGNRSVQFLIKDIRLSYPKNVNNDKQSIELFSKTSPTINNLYNINDIDKSLICEKFNVETVESAIEGNLDINIFEYIKENTLIITNTINGFYRAISDISLTEYEYDINYNIIENNKENNKVQLIFSPNIDKIDVKRYNNIILYDYLYNIGEYSYLLNNMNSESLIIKYYSKMDLLYLNNIINNIVPDREEFINVYKLALSQKNITINIVDIKKVFNIIPIKLFSILKVFEELSLLEFDIKNDDNSKDKKLIVNLLPKPDKKLNLDESKILNNLKLLSKEYQESY